MCSINHFYSRADILLNCSRNNLENITTVLLQTFDFKHIHPFACFIQTETYHKT